MGRLQHRIYGCNKLQYALVSSKDLLYALNRVLNFIPLFRIPRSAFYRLPYLGILGHLR